MSFSISSDQEVVVIDIVYICISAFSSEWLDGCLVFFLNQAHNAVVKNLWEFSLVHV